MLQQHYSYVYWAMSVFLQEAFVMETEALSRNYYIHGAHSRPCICMCLSRSIIQASRSRHHNAMILSWRAPWEGGNPRPALHTKSPSQKKSEKNNKNKKLKKTAASSWWFDSLTFRRAALYTHKSIIQSGTIFVFIYTTNTVRNSYCRHLEIYFI